MPFFSRHLSAEDQDLLIEYYGSGCYYCGQRISTVAEYSQLKPTEYDGIALPDGFPLLPQFDHQIPKSRGGSNRSENLVPSCCLCNQRKNAMTPDEFKRRLISLGEMREGDLFYGEIIEDLRARGEL